MTKQKIGVVVGGSLAALLLAGGGFWVGTGHHSVQAAANLDGAASIPANAAQTSGSTTLLNQDNASGGGLNVSSASNASSLGQLGGSPGAQSGTSNIGSNNSSGSSSSSSQAIDPSTFSQYDKYKDQTQALFGDIQKGSGTALTANKKAVVYYKGWLTNGQLFDESRADSSGQVQPFTFTLGAHQVISGWEEGLAGMQVGGTRLLVVPPSVGYGAQGQGSIPPNSVLVFEVKLLNVQ